MALIQCRNCGASVSDKAQNCPKCGSPISVSGAESQQMTPAYMQVNAAPQQQYTTTSDKDFPNVGLNILSFILPIVGWILYFVFKAETPNKAKSCAKWAWIGFACSFVIGFIRGCAEALIY